MLNRLILKEKHSSTVRELEMFHRMLSAPVLISYFWSSLETVQLKTMHLNFVGSKQIITWVLNNKGWLGFLLYGQYWFQMWNFTIGLKFYDTRVVQVSYGVYGENGNDLGPLPRHYFCLCNGGPLVSSLESLFLNSIVQPMLLNKGVHIDLAH